jgi:glycosyltransferase involved in cell wall biosynthesis
MDRYKIVHIIPSLASGGAERITVDICNALTANHDVYLIQIMKDEIPSYSFYQKQLSSQITYINLKGGEGRVIDVKCMIKILHYLNKIKPKVVHSHLNITYSFLPSLFFLGINFFHTIHNEAEKECVVVKGFSLKKIIKFFYKNNFIEPITISEASRNSFVNFYKLKTPLLVKNGCAQKKPSDKFASVVQEINSYKNNRNDIVFLNIGRCARQKNHTLLIKVFNKLIEEGHNIILLIIGDGFDSIRGQGLLKLAKKNIHFLGSKQNVADYFFACDAFCLSSEYEGLPITLLEAISAGCVPVCTPVGGVPEVLREGVGFCSTNLSEEAYYIAILTFLSEKNSINNNYLIEYFKINYSIKSTVKVLENIYQNKDLTD